MCQPGIIPTSFFSLGGEALKTEDQKEKLRTLEWAYRFWLSGQDDQVRSVQIRQAMDRVNVFYSSPQHHINNRNISDYVSSECGVALLLDQHVNRPGHVPKTLQQALDKVGNSGEPEGWTDEDEKHLLEIYIDLRASTSMTDSNKRAQVTLEEVRNGTISDRRGSFKIT